MNTHVDFETAKLLKEKGYINGIHYDGIGGYFTNITISDAIMWLYKKYKIWIVSLPLLINGVDIDFYPSIYEQGVGEDLELYFKSPTEAYLAGIRRCLTELV